MKYVREAIVEWLELHGPASVYEVMFRVAYDRALVAEGLLDLIVEDKVRLGEAGRVYLS